VRNVDELIGGEVIAQAAGAAASALPEPTSLPSAAVPPAPSATSTATTVDPAPEVPAASRTHQVVRGETLDGIARKYGTSVAEIQRLNPQVQPRRLLVGQALTIPVD
jgi:LysM repeat protein